MSADILQTGRDWGSRFLPIVDKLSDGYEMRKLTDEKSMIEAGKELSVCIGVSAGDTERQEALTGHQEIWGLFNPSNQCVAMATVGIDEMKGVRYIKEIRGYKNEGFRHHGYGDYIDEWLSLHPDYYYTGRMKKGTEYDSRGFWEDAYLDQDDDDDGDSLLAELVQNDIGELDRLFDDVSPEFKRSLLSLIVRDIDELKSETVKKYFTEFPDLIERALNISIDQQKNHISLLVILSDMGIDIKEYMLNFFSSSWSDYYFDIDDVSKLLKIYKSQDPEFFNKLIKIGKNSYLDDLSRIESFQDDQINASKLACFMFDDSGEILNICDFIYSALEDLLVNSQPIKNSLVRRNNLVNFFDAFTTLCNQIGDDLKIEKTVSLFSKIIDKEMHWSLLGYLDKDILESDELANMIDRKIDDTENANDLLYLCELNNSIITKIYKNGNRAESQKYLSNIDSILKQIYNFIEKNNRKDVMHKYSEYEIVDLLDLFTLSPEYISIINDSFIKYDPDFAISYEYLNKLLDPKVFRLEEDKENYYILLKQDIIKIINILEKRDIDVIEYFSHLFAKSLAVLYYLGFLSGHISLNIMSYMKEYDLTTSDIIESTVIRNMVKISNSIDNIASDISDSIDKLLERFL